MELNKDLHSKELVKLNGETFDWKWHYLEKENKIYALDSIQQKSYTNFWRDINGGIIFFTTAAIVHFHSNIYMQLFQSLILVTIASIIYYRINKHVLDYYTIDQKKLINTDSEISLNIVRLLNLYKEYDKKEEYNNLMQEVINNANGIGINLNEKYKDVDIDSIEALRYKYYAEDKDS